MEGSEFVPFAVPKAGQLAEHLQHLIESGALAEGARLGTKAELQTQHGVAHGTINETLRMLQVRGFVQLRSGPRGGAFVAPRQYRTQLRHTVLDVVGDATAIEEYVRVRDALEDLVAVEAALAYAPTDRGRLIESLEELRNPIDAATRLHAVWNLHREIARTGRNTTATSLYVALLDAIEESTIRPQDRPKVPPGVRGDTYAVHAAIVHAIISGSVEAVVAATRAHRPIAAPKQDRALDGEILQATPRYAE
jgi:DNA-binding FadR family transcriptional regulator